MDQTPFSIRHFDVISAGDFTRHIQSLPKSQWCSSGWRPLGMFCLHEASLNPLCALGRAPCRLSMQKVPRTGEVEIGRKPHKKIDTEARKGSSWCETLWYSGYLSPNGTIHFLSNDLFRWLVSPRPRADHVFLNLRGHEPPRIPSLCSP